MGLITWANYNCEPIHFSIILAAGSSDDAEPIAVLMLLLFVPGYFVLG